MLLVILFGAILVSLMLIDVLAYLPLDVLQGLKPSAWVSFAVLFGLFAWCFGDE